MRVELPLPLLLLLLLLVVAPSAHAWRLWPAKRFAEEGLVRAGALGLDDVRGQVAAWSYFSSTRFLDVWIVDAQRQSVSVHAWDHTHFRFNATPVTRVSVPDGLHIVDAMVADYTHDGHADLLVMAERPTSTTLSLYLWAAVVAHDGTTTLAPPITLPASTRAHPLTIDATGALAADLLGHVASDPTTLTLWHAAQDTVVTEPLAMHGDGTPPCQLAHPHSSAHVDMNGDCLADLFLVCDAGRGRLSYQVWTARRDAPRTYDLARVGDLPPGTGALSFADMNRDGTIDVVFPACERDRCYIHIAYNEQMPLCAPERRGVWGARNASAERCRDAAQLCAPDDAFVLRDGPDLVRIPIDALTSDRRLLLVDDVGASQPVPVRVGDYNLDGYPDLAVLTVPRGAAPGETRLHLLESRPCGGASGAAAGCAPSGPEHRTFARVRRSVLDREAYVRSVAFIDLDEDGTLDLMLQSLPPATTRASAARVVSFVRNNDFHDAFFLKALSQRRADGSALLGASYKFAVLDPNGVRRAQQVAQQAQTVYGALPTPYAFFGLGRTNNYVESLFVGSTLRRAPAPLVLEGVVPNSEVRVYPNGADTWRRELFLHPADWIPYVTLALGTLLALLAAIIYMLDRHEKHEDERERRRAVHAINFDAL